MNRTSFPLLALVFTLVCASGFAASFRFVPMSIVLDSEPRRGTLTVVNTGEEKVTVQLQMMSWAQDAHGFDIYLPTKDLVFFPQIVTLGPGKEGLVRVGYEPAGPLATEKTYRLFVQELPISKPGETAIKITLRVGIPIFITPKEPRTALSMGEARVDNGKLVVTIANSGTSHSMVQTIAFVGIDAGGHEVFSHESKGWYVLSGSSKVFPLDVSAEECQNATSLKVTGTTGDATVEETFGIQAGWSAQLAESSKKAEDERERLKLPAEAPPEKR